jgi:hypothetical protein
MNVRAVRPELSINFDGFLRNFEAPLRFAQPAKDVPEIVKARGKVRL